MQKMMTRTGTWLAISALVVLGVSASVAQAEILYDGANTSGVTTDDQYVIDYDQTGTIRDLQFGSNANYLRFDTSSNRFMLSNDLDMQSKQLINARIQNVAVTADVPTCATAADRGKKIFTGAATITLASTQVLTANTEYVCNDTNSAATRWVASLTGSASNFLRRDASDTYVGGGAGNNTMTFGNAGNAVSVVFDPTNSTVTLGQTTSNTFNVNSDAAATDSSTLSFGNGSGTLIWNGTTNLFTLNNSLTVSGTATANSLVVNSGGSVNLNNNQVQNLRMENLAALPATPTVGRLVYLTANDTTAPGCTASAPCNAGAYYFNGTKWVRQSADGGSATLEFSPQFPDSVVRPGTGTNHVGTLVGDTDTTGNRNFYRWSTNKATLQDIDVAVDVRLPDDFGGFAATNALQYDIRANDTVNTNAKLDLSGKDTSGTAMTISGTVAGVAATVANAWQTNSHNITAGTYAAGQRVQLTFKLSALAAKTFDLGNFRLNYVRKSP